MSVQLISKQEREIIDLKPGYVAMSDLGKWQLAIHFGCYELARSLEQPRKPGDMFGWPREDL